jgi:glutaredoxin
MDNTITLYGTPSCHLCEEAYAILEPLAKALALNIQQIDIMDHDELLKAYGLHIPVLVTYGDELRWPFDIESARKFLLLKKD